MLLGVGGEQNQAKRKVNTGLTHYQQYWDIFQNKDKHSTALAVFPNSDKIWNFYIIGNKGCRCKRGYCMAITSFNINWKVPSVFDCKININISFSGFLFPKIPRPWWKLVLLNQQFKEKHICSSDWQWRTMKTATVPLNVWLEPSKSPYLHFSQ